MIAAPGSIEVHFFERELAFDSADPSTHDAAWTHNTTATPAVPNEPVMTREDKCGILGTVAIHGDFAAVGCRGREVVILYRRMGGAWQQSAELRSGLYHEYLFASVVVRHPAQFGASVAMNGKWLAVGAPQEFYGDIPDATNTDEVTHMPFKVEERGTGAAFIYHIPSADTRLPVGFTINTVNFTSQMSFPQGQALKQAGNPPRLVEDLGGDLWVEHQIIQPSVPARGSNFGAAIAIDGSQLVVGAFGSAAMPTTTWDFEVGYLRGWRATGDAFTFQPTHGDNVAHRDVYPDVLGNTVRRRSGHRGRYWIGTFEKRPGDRWNNTAGDYIQPSSVYAAGNAQGDAPKGTLTSDPFSIGGARISLLIGGGCDPQMTFVELIIDGTSVYKAVGACSEEMIRVTWDVDRWFGRTGQIRIVDASAGKWGHINIDDIRFDWAIAAYHETPMSGLAEVYRIKDSGSPEPCTPHTGRLACVWESEGRLVPNDKRQNTRFGRSVAIDDATGTIIVGAYLQGPVYPDWFYPGSTFGARLGLFGSEHSMRGDGGVNNGEKGGLLFNAWEDRENPFLRNRGPQQGRFALEMRELDHSGNSARFGSTGRESSIGNWFSSSGGFSGVRGTYHPEHPWDRKPIIRDRQGLDVRLERIYTESRGGTDLDIDVGTWCDAVHGKKHNTACEPAARRDGAGYMVGVRMGVRYCRMHSYDNFSAVAHSCVCLS